MGKGSGRRRGKHKAARAGLQTGAGTGVAADLVADDGFERAVVTVDDGTTATPQRRIDNLQRLEQAVGAQAVQALRLLRDAAEAAEAGIAGRCALDTSPRGSSAEDLISYRIDASRRFDAAWAAVPEDCRRAVSRVALDGWGLHRAAVERGGRNWRAQQMIKDELRRAADAIYTWLDGRYGKARPGWTWDADHARGEVRITAEAA